jgi:transglutaminase-like putative cysteine protease
MAILLRVLGVPARVVNGFAQGRWNEYGRFFTVRQSDAHAWVEVYFPSHGWVVFDPTRRRRLATRISNLSNSVISWRMCTDIQSILELNGIVM